MSETFQKQLREKILIALRLKKLKTQSKLAKIDDGKSYFDNKQPRAAPQMQTAIVPKIVVLAEVIGGNLPNILKVS